MISFMNLCMVEIFAVNLAESQGFLRKTWAVIHHPSPVYTSFLTLYDGSFTVNAVVIIEINLLQDTNFLLVYVMWCGSHFTSVKVGIKSKKRRLLRGIRNVPTCYNINANLVANTLRRITYGAVQPHLPWWSAVLRIAIAPHRGGATFSTTSAKTLCISYPQAAQYRSVCY